VVETAVAQAEEKTGKIKKVTKTKDEVSVDDIPF
jgi:hypothetical protein